MHSPWHWFDQSRVRAARRDGNCQSPYQLLHVMRRTSLVVLCIAMISRVPLFWFLHTRDVCRLSIYVSIEFPASCAHSRRCLCAIERRKMGELHKHTPKLIKLAYENDHMSVSDYMMAMMIDEILHRRREKSGLCSLSRLEDEQSFENSVEQIAIAAIRWKIIISRI